MPILCPRCHKEVDFTKVTCGLPQCLPPKHGVFRLMEESFFEKWEPYLIDFEKVREKEGLRIKEPELYPQMPFTRDYKGPFRETWLARQADLQLIKKLISDRNNLRILNFGSWNGWLSNKLAECGHQVTAISLYLDPFDGLGAKKHFHTDWLAIQMDVADPSIIQETYDVIVINRCISFLTDPFNTLDDLISKLEPGGILIITGIHIYRNPSGKIKELQSVISSYRSKYNLELDFFGMKGYLDLTDKKRFVQKGIKLKAYPGKKLSAIAAGLIPTRPSLYCGIYIKEQAG